MSDTAGRLYVVATPIGNLKDITARAIEILKSVDLIAAEDTRHARVLLDHFAIFTPVRSLHQHNEAWASEKLLDKIQQGLSVALISDAGTPLLNDPGLPLIRMAKQRAISAIPVPGACALVTALSVAGLPLDRFVFEGFPPRAKGAREAFFIERRNQASTWVFYEASHRIVDTLTVMAQALPVERQIVVAKELTKLHERLLCGNAAEVLEKMIQQPELQKGEFVVLVEPAPEVARDEMQLTCQEMDVLERLLSECSLKTAVALTVELTGAKKSVVYRNALELQRRGA